MSIKNIFDVRKENRDFKILFEKIYKKVNEIEFLYENGIFIEPEKRFKRLSLEDYANIFFPKWKQSQWDSNLEEFKTNIGIDNIKHKSDTNELTKGDLLRYLEYILNLYKIIELYADEIEKTGKSINVIKEKYYIKSSKEEYFKIKSDIEMLINDLDFKVEYFKNEEKVLVVEKK